MNVVVVIFTHNFLSIALQSALYLNICFVIVWWERKTNFFQNVIQDQSFFNSYSHFSDKLERSMKKIHDLSMQTFVRYKSHAFIVICEYRLLLIPLWNGNTIIFLIQIQRCLLHAKFYGENLQIHVINVYEENEKRNIRKKM